MTKSLTLDDSAKASPDGPHRSSPGSLWGDVKNKKLQLRRQTSGFQGHRGASNSIAARLADSAALAGEGGPGPKEFLKRYHSAYDALPAMEAPPSVPIVHAFGRRGIAMLGCLLFAVLTAGTFSVWYFTGIKTSVLVLCLVQLDHQESSAQVSCLCLPSLAFAARCLPFPAIACRRLPIACKSMAFACH